MLIVCRSRSSDLQGYPELGELEPHQLLGVSAELRRRQHPGHTDQGASAQEAQRGVERQFAVCARRPRVHVRHTQDYHQLQSACGRSRCSGARRCLQKRLVAQGARFAGLWHHYSRLVLDQASFSTIKYIDNI